MRCNMIIDTRTVNQIICGQIIYWKQFFYRKRIISSQRNHLCIFQNHFIQFILKFFIFIVPEKWYDADKTQAEVQQTCDLNLLLF